MEKLCNVIPFILLAANPVDAVLAIFFAFPYFLVSIFIIKFVTVLFPVPAFPVKKNDFPLKASSIAFFCSLSNTISLSFNNLFNKFSKLFLLIFINIK